MTFLRAIISLLGLACIGAFLYYLMPMLIESAPHGVYLAVDHNAVLDMRMNREEGEEPDPQDKVDVLANHKVKITTIFYSAAGLSNMVFGASLDGEELAIEANLSDNPDLPDAIEFTIDIPPIVEEAVKSIPSKLRVWAIDRSRDLTSQELFAYVLPIPSSYSFRITDVSDIKVDSENIVGQFLDKDVGISAVILRDDLKLADDYIAVVVLTPKINPEFERKRAEMERTGKEPTEEEQKTDKMRIYQVILGQPFLAKDKAGQMAEGEVKLKRVFSENVGSYSVAFPDISIGIANDFDRRFLIHLIMVKKAALATLTNALPEITRIGDILDDPSLKDNIIMVDDGVEVHRKPKPRKKPTEAETEAKPESAPEKTAPKPSATPQKKPSSKPSTGKKSGGVEGVGKVDWE